MPIFIFLPLIIFLTIFLSSASAQAQEDLEIDELMSLDLADLMVSVASKKEESIYDAPSITSVITSQEIEKYGGKNLLDVLNRHTGTQVYGSSMIPETVVSIRAQSIQHENNHVLILINGRPFRDSLTGGFVGTILSSFPLGVIEQIEIIRGPGSVLYGSSAYSGVINIKTKSVDRIGRGFVETSYGSYNTKMVNTAVSQKNGDWDFVAGAKMLDSKGWDYTATDVALTTETFQTNDEDSGAFLSANYKNFSINTFFGETAQLSMSPTSLFPVVSFSSRHWFLDAGYKQEITEYWSVQYNATYNRFDYDEITADTDDLNVEVSVQGEVTKNLDILFGGSFENQDLHLPGKDVSDQWYNAYAQASYVPKDWLKLVGGVQMNKPTGLKKDFSPRVAAIITLNEHSGVKILYGEAFRSGGFIEKESNFPGVIVGNPDIKPETIATTEVQVFYHAPRLDLALTYYHSKMEGLITRVGFLPINFANVGHINFYGIEIEGKGRLNDHFDVMGNLALQTNEDETGADDTTFVPNIIAKFGVSYDSHTGYTAGLYESYFGNPAQIRDFKAIVESNPEPTAHHLVTLKTSVDMQEVLDNYKIPKTTFSFFVDNLLDEEIRFPDINAQNNNSIPIHSGRAIYGSVKIEF